MFLTSSDSSCQAAGGEQEGGEPGLYSVRDPIINKVLQLMRRYFHAHLKEAMDMLGEMEKPLASAK